MKIIKKVQQRYFEDIVDGKKQFEVRLADFRCKPGDVLLLKEQRQGTKKLTGREHEFEVLYKLNTKEVYKWYSKKEIEKHGLLILSIRKKFRHK
jgi:ASC-1-like (ASCH) protein